MDQSIWLALQALFGSKHAIEPQRYCKDITLAANASATETIVINRGSDFVLCKIRHTSTGTFEAGLNAENRDFQDALIPAAQWGNDQDGDVLDDKLECYPAVVRGGQSLKITAKDTSGAGNTVCVVLEGVNLL